MPTFKHWFLFFIFSTCMLRAGLTMQPITEDVYFQGASERAGQISFTVDSNVFLEIPSVGPIYLRFQIDHAAELCSTLVWSHPDNQDTASFQRIFLPLSLVGGAPGDRVVAPPETVSIVRWKKGEGEFWLKVEHPTETWIQRADGSTVAPSNELQILWHLGLSARQSFELNQPLFQAGHANLPSATRDPANLTNAAAVSTLCCVDVSVSNIQPMPASPQESSLHFSPVAHQTGVASGPGSVEESFGQNGIFIGGGSVVTIAGADPVASAFDFDCTGFVLSDPGPVMVVDPQLPGLLQLTNQLGIELDCGSPWGVHRDSVIRLKTGPDSAQGFRVAVDGNNQPRDYNEVDASIPPGNFVLLENELSLLNASHAPPRGRTADLFQTPKSAYLCRSAELVYTGTGTTSPLAWIIRATVSQWNMAEPTPVNLSLAVEASSRDDSGDMPPFTGSDQQQFCNPSLKSAFQYNWTFGTFPVTVPTLSGWSLLILILLLGALAPLAARRQHVLESNTSS